MCNRGAGLGHPMDPVVSVQNKNFSGNTKELAKVLGARLEAQSHLQDLPWNLAKPVKIFPGITVRRHHANRKHNGLSERAARRVKESTSAVLLQLWMKIGGQITWNAVPICGTFKISCLMGRPHMKDALENLLKDQSFRLVHWLIENPTSAKDQSRIHQLGKKVLPGLFLGYALYAEGIWKGDTLVADIEELEMMDASEIYSERLSAKEVIFPQKMENSYFQSQMHEQNLLEEIRH